MSLPLPEDPAVTVAAASAVIALFALGVSAWMAKTGRDALKTAQDATVAAKDSAAAARMSAEIMHAGLVIRYSLRPVTGPLSLDPDLGTMQHRIAISSDTVSSFIHKIDVDALFTKNSADIQNRIIGKFTIFVDSKMRLHQNEVAVIPVPADVLSQAMTDALDNPRAITGGEATVWYSLSRNTEPIPIEARFEAKPLDPNKMPDILVSSVSNAASLRRP